MNMFKFLATMAVSTALVVSSIKPVLAQEYCESTSGGYGTVCREGVVSLDKLVWDADQGIYVDNLGTGDAFRAGNEITFRLRITNTGDYRIDTVYVRDELPSYVEYVSGPQADDIRNVNYDSGNHRLTFELIDLAIDETRNIDFRVRVIGENSLPSSACVVNWAEAEANGQKDSDTAQICVAKEGEVLGTVYPETGPTQVQWLLLEALGLAIVGTLLIKTAQIKE